MVYFVLEYTKIHNQSYDNYRVTTILNLTQNLFRWYDKYNRQGQDYRNRLILWFAQSLYHTCRSYK